MPKVGVIKAVYIYFNYPKIDDCRETLVVRICKVVSRFGRKTVRNAQQITQNLLVFNLF